MRYAGGIDGSLLLLPALPEQAALISLVDLGVPFASVPPATFSALALVRQVISAIVVGD